MSAQLTSIPNNATFSIQNYASSKPLIGWTSPVITTTLSCGVIYLLYGASVYAAAWGYSGSGDIIFYEILNPTPHNMTVTAVGNTFNFASTVLYGNVNFLLTVKILQATSVTNPPPLQLQTYKNCYTVFGIQAPYAGGTLYITTNANTSGWIIGISSDNSNMYFVVNYNTQQYAVAVPGGDPGVKVIHTYGFVNYNCSTGSYYNNVTVHQDNGISASWAICMVSSGSQ